MSNLNNNFQLEFPVKNAKYLDSDQIRSQLVDALDSYYAKTGDPVPVKDIDVWQTLNLPWFEKYLSVLVIASGGREDQKLPFKEAWEGFSSERKEIFDDVFETRTSKCQESRRAYKHDGVWGSNQYYVLIGISLKPISGKVLRKVRRRWTTAYKRNTSLSIVLRKIS